MNRFVPKAAFAALCLAAGAAHAVTPAVDLTGVWESDGGGTLQIFQAADAATMVFVGPDFAHRLRLAYRGPRLADGVQVRVTRATGCTTFMTVVYTVLTADLVQATSVALDSNCDLSRGQQFVNMLSRTL